MFAFELSELRTERGLEKGTAKLKGFNSAKDQELHGTDPAEAQLPRGRGTLLNRLGPRHKAWLKNATHAQMKVVQWPCLYEQ